MTETYQKNVADLQSVLNIPKCGIGNELNEICLLQIPCVQRYKQVSIVAVLSHNVCTTHVATQIGITVDANKS